MEAKKGMDIMCLAIPMKIQSIHGPSATCEASGLTQTIRMDFIKDACPSDYVMVHAGFAIQTLSEKKALDNFPLLGNIRKSIC